jgi:anti-anti-sigma regulatory factor
MTTFASRSERRIGVIEVTGALNDDAIVGLRGAIAEAVRQSGAPRVLIIADGITAISEDAALIVVIECATLRAKGGNAAWISTGGQIATPRSVPAATLYMSVYRSLRTALDLFGIENAP